MDSNAKRVLAVLVSVSLLVNYVETMVVPAIPDIQQDFSASTSIMAWVTSAFTVVAAVVSPLFGKLADMYGKRRLYLLCMAFYSLAVIIAGFAPNIYVLIAARAIQGLGFAMFPISLAIITDILAPEMIAMAQGIISGTLGIGTALGLVVGSYLDQYLGWQYAFHIAFAFSIVLLVAAARLIPETGARAPRDLDLAGFTTLSLGMLLVLVYLTEGPDWGWLTQGSLSLLVPGLLLTLYFFLHERRAKGAMIDLRLMGIRNVMVANISGVISGILLLSMFYGVIYYAELPPPFGLGLDVISTGLTLAPATLLMLILGPFMGRSINRVGPKPLMIMGSGVMVLGFLAFIWNRGSRISLTLDSVIAMLGMLSIMIPLVNMIAISLPEESRGVGLGMNTLLRNLGSSVGPVIATSIMSTYKASTVFQVAGVYLVNFFPSSTAFNYVFAVGIIMSILNAVVALGIRNYRFGQRRDVAEEGKGEVPTIGTPIPRAMRKEDRNADGTLSHSR